MGKVWILLDVLSHLGIYKWKCPAEIVTLLPIYNSTDDFLRLKVIALESKLYAFFHVILKLHHALKPMRINPARPVFSIKKRKYWVHPILRWRGKSSTSLRSCGMIRWLSSLQDVRGSVWCFATDTVDTFKKKSELGVQGSLQCVVLRDEVDQLVKRHSGFWRSLIRWL